MMLFILILITACAAKKPMKNELLEAEAVSLCGDENNDGVIAKEELALFFSNNDQHFMSNSLIPFAGGIPDFVFKHFISHDRNFDSKCTVEETKAYALVHTKAMDNCDEIQMITNSVDDWQAQKAKVSKDYQYSSLEAQAFSHCIDVNRDGVLTRQEFTTFFGMQILENELKDVNGLEEFISRMMIKYDGNNDGFVTDPEFRAVVMVYFRMIQLCQKK